jgi:beta-galactosidase
VDAVRIKKQNFEVFRVMQSGSHAVKILGHWNYPPEDGINYRYPVKRFEGGIFIKTGEYKFREPKNKTVCVVGSYGIRKVELFVNGESKGICEKPDAAFIFRFKGIDVTASGFVSAKGYAYDGTVVDDRIDTVGEPSSIRLTPRTGAEGLLADGTDLVYFDVEVVDGDGRVCPLCFDRINFTLTGPAKFLGGYNSGKFNGFGRNDSVIHQNHVYAECGTNRVFARAGSETGEITLKAVMGTIAAEATVRSVEISADVLVDKEPQILEASKVKSFTKNDYGFKPIPEADAVKYTPDSRVYCDFVINGGEKIDQRARRAVYADGAIWGPLFIVLDKIRSTVPNGRELLEYSYDELNRRVTVRTGGKEIIAEYGSSHLLVNGKENLMGGAPTLNREIFWMEVNAVISQIDWLTARYDTESNIYRIDRGNSS